MTSSTIRQTADTQTETRKNQAYCPPLSTAAGMSSPWLPGPIINSFDHQIVPHQEEEEEEEVQDLSPPQRQHLLPPNGNHQMNGIRHQDGDGYNGVERVTVCEPVINSLVRSAVFPERSRSISAMDFHPQGEFLVVAGRDDKIMTYHALQGTFLGEIHCMKYGTGLVRFTNSNHTVVHSSYKVNDALRLCCVSSNKYLAYFTGHTGPVISLGMMPQENNSTGLRSIFASGSQDGTVRLWDIRMGGQTAMLQLDGSAPLIAAHPFLPELAVGLRNYNVEVFDIRYLIQNNEEGGRRPKLKHSALEFPLVMPGERWTGLKFSSSGDKLLISSTAPIIRSCSSSRIKLILDHVPRGGDGGMEVEEGEVEGEIVPDYGVRMLRGFGNRRGTILEPSFSPAGDYVFGGDDDGIIHAWHLDTMKEVWSGVESMPGMEVQIANFNPQYLMMAAASGRTLSFWSRAEEEESDESFDTSQEF